MEVTERSDSLSAQALVARVQTVRLAARAYRHARGEPVWEAPERHDDGTLRGWRTWDVANLPHDKPVRLRSFNGAPDNAWPRGVLVARCLREQDHAVNPDCTCGIYGFNNLATLYREAGVGVEPRRFVVGEIAGWGRVCLHEYGWRAEYAMVRALWTRGLTPKEDADLSSFYEVTVGALDEPFSANNEEGAREDR